MATLLGAALAHAAHIPAGALLGSMAVSLTAALTLSIHVPVPRRLMLGAQAVLGTAICASLTPEAWATLLENWPVALLNVVGVVGVSQAVALLFSRWTGVDALISAFALVAGCALLAWGWSALGGVDVLTAYFATSPGGADSVLAIALGTQASLTLVLAVQVGRVLFNC